MRPEIELVPYSAGMVEASPLLVLAPHPDDEVFGCGGLLVRAVQAGSKVHVVVVTDGGAQGDPATRGEESRAAARRMGLDEPELWGLADRSLDPADPGLRGRIIEVLERTRPEAILVTSPAEVHPDHRALGLATYEVLRETASQTGAVPDDARLLSYEVSAVLRPNLLVDVTPVWDVVMAAAHAFASQVEAKPYLEVFEAIATARRLTLPPEVRRAEAYHAVDVAWVRGHGVAEWAARQGPAAGLAADLPEAASDRERLRAEVERLQALFREVEASRTWRLYRFFDRLLRGRR